MKVGFILPGVLIRMGKNVFELGVSLCVSAVICLASMRRQSQERNSLLSALLANARNFDLFQEGRKS